MSKKATVEAVDVNGRTVAIRISFQHHGRSYVRQYAIIDGVSYADAVMSCYKYRDRIVNRSSISDDDPLTKHADQLIDIMRAREAARELIMTAVRRDVRTVLDRYSAKRNIYEYENVYGTMTTKKNPDLL